MPERSMVQAGIRAVRERTIIRNVYLWMTLGLVLTGVVALGFASTPRLVISLVRNPVLFFGLIIGEFMLVFFRFEWNHTFADFSSIYRSQQNFSFLHNCRDVCRNEPVCNLHEERSFLHGTLPYHGAMGYHNSLTGKHILEEYLLLLDCFLCRSCPVSRSYSIRYSNDKKNE